VQWDDHGRADTRTNGEANSGTVDEAECCAVRVAIDEAECCAVYLAYIWADGAYGEAYSGTIDEADCFAVLAAVD